LSKILWDSPFGKGTIWLMNLRSYT
jgi:hypothetical protein